mgnify:CR=1 FL=1
MDQIMLPPVAHAHDADGFIAVVDLVDDAVLPDPRELDVAAVGRTALEILRVDRVHILLGSDPRQLNVAHLAGLPHPELWRGQEIDLTEMGESLHRRALEEQVRLDTEDWTRDERVNKEIARRWAGAAALIVWLPPPGQGRTTGPRPVSYVGVDSCAECHAEETAAWARRPALLPLVRSKPAALWPVTIRGGHPATLATESGAPHPGGSRDPAWRSMPRP